VALGPKHVEAAQFERPHLQRASIVFMRAQGYRSGMKKQHFWNVDLLELFRMWISDIGTFLLTALLFVGLALPVIIPSLILWYLWSIDWHP
jgi:hypothetical protein